MKFILVLSLLTSANLYAQKTFRISSKVYQGYTKKFIPHMGNPADYGTYLSMELPYEPVSDLFQQLLISKKAQDQFTSRGEAHITVVTPPEYNNQLSQYLSPKKLNKIGHKAKIQNAKFKVECLGLGRDIRAIYKTSKENQAKTKRLQIKTGEQPEETYFIVVSSKDLIEIREKVLEEAIAVANKKGLPMPKFDPEAFQPHITVGFTKEDLHNVVKTDEACGRNKKNLRVTR